MSTTAPRDISFFALRTKRGWVGICFRDDALMRLCLPERTKRLVQTRMNSEWGRLANAPLPDALIPLGEILEAYFDGQAVDPARTRAPLSLEGLTPFRTRVYRALRRVPRGRVTTYGRLAHLAGSPGAARGVGTAMASNPFPLVVPCHRVVGSDLELRGFSATGGLDTKRELLALEGWDGTSFYRR